MKAEDIRNMPSGEIGLQIEKAREQLFKFRFQSAREEMQRAGEIRQLRKDIARCKTVLSERGRSTSAVTSGEAVSAAVIESKGAGDGVS